MRLLSLPLWTLPVQPARVQQLRDSWNKPRKLITNCKRPDNVSVETARLMSFCIYTRFGASSQDISIFLSTYGDPVDTSLKAWITNQITSVPMSSHREFYRENTNPRWDRVSGSARSLVNPCAKTARWRTVALTSRDQPLRRISVERFGAKYLLKIDDKPRTVLDSIELAPGGPGLVLGTQYNMCPPGKEFWREAIVRELVLNSCSSSSS